MINQKKGNIAFNLLPIAAVLLSLVALYSFVSFEDNLKSDMKDVPIVTDAIKLRYSYVFANAELIASETINSGIPTDLKAKYQELTERKEPLVWVEGAGNFFLKIRAGEFNFGETLENGEKFYTLEAIGLFVKAESGNTELTRDYAMKIKFDSKGKVVAYLY